MGRGGAILTVGRPLGWDEGADKMAYVREHGVTQFMAHYARHKDVARDHLFYGDEIEYGLFRLDAASRRPYLSLRGAEVRELLANREVEERRAIPESGKVTWHPEYGSWMVESTPARPYSGYTDDLRRVETNMRSRRARLLAALQSNEIAPTVVCFPLLGVGDSAGPEPANGPDAASALVPDAVINPHPRFGTLTRNIRARRGSNVECRLPLYQDEKTQGSEIAVDAMAFGMGCCCLQVTFQCRDVDESRHVYDQLAVLAPVMLALTAACPVVNGRLSDLDTRWGLVAQSVDDRTPAERGEASGTPDARMAGGGVAPVRTSRYSAAASYLCSHKQRCDLVCAHYNDVDVEVDERAKARLLDAGFDELLATHVAHLFARDPLVLFEGLVEEVDDAVATDHFENLQSTNWNSVRWKPPPAGSPEHVGWRVELRTMEVQLTDYENAAFTVFCVLVLRVLLSFDLNIYVPMSKVHENMARAEAREAAHKGTFWWRSHMVRPDSGHRCQAQQDGKGCSVHDDDESVVEMTALEILTGKGGYYPGLVPLVLVYLDSIGCDPDTASRVKSYLDLIVKRASGELKTAATWTRDFVKSHPDYQGDSVVPPTTAHDLLKRCHDVGVGAAHEPGLLGPDVKVAPIRKEQAYNVQLARVHFQASQSLQTLLDQYAERARTVKRRADAAAGVARLKAELAAKEAEVEALDRLLEPPSGPPMPSRASFHRLRADSEGTISVGFQSEAGSDRPTF